MTRKAVDYNVLAATYNLRFADGKDLTQTARVLENLAQQSGAQAILEVGCGTGRWLAELSAIADHCCGLDPSTGMLAQAQQRGPHLALTRGRGEGLPFPDAAFDLVYCVNAIHHMTGQHTFIQEAWRVLRPGGTLAVIGMDPHGRREKWYIYDYFAGTYETDLARFPSWETVLNWMIGTGFRQTERRIVEHIVDHKYGRAVLEDLFLQKHAISQLALLSDDAYAAGRRKLQMDVESAETRGEAVTFPVEIMIEILTGQRP